MSQTRDLFFDEFYRELEEVVQGILNWDEGLDTPSILAPKVLNCWNQYLPDATDRTNPIISVDGGVQISRFAYGGFVTVARALALAHTSKPETTLHKRVKIHVQEVYNDRDRGFIPVYARMIAEYDAAYVATCYLLEKGLRPVIIMDGSLYLARFPYAIREYVNHSELLVELFNSITSLRTLARENDLPLVGVTKDSTVFYLYMRLLKDTIAKTGLGHLNDMVMDSTTPFDLRMKAEAIDSSDRLVLEPFLERRPLCDTALIRTYAKLEGYTRPLLLAPSIYQRRSKTTELYNRIRRNLPKERAKSVIGSLQAFFDTPGVAVTYWRPQGTNRPFRIDLLAHSLGHSEPWINQMDNTLIEGDKDFRPLEKVFNHLGHWFCNDVEYNLPLHQVDRMARFDRDLYKSRYEPFIIHRLEQAGFDLTGSRRMQREYEG